MKAIIKFKEVHANRVLETTYVGENLTRNKIVDFFGLNNSDVEWYDVEITNN